MADIKIKITTAIGEPNFRIKFGEDAPIASIEFTLPPPLAVVLMHGIHGVADEFHWIDALNAMKHGAKLN